MAFNLLEAVRSYVSPSLIDRASNQFGESGSSISKGIAALIPTMLAGFISRAERGDGDGLLRDAHEAADSNVLNNLSELPETGVGSFLSGGIDRLRGMFGGQSDNIISSVTNFAGIKNTTAQGLLGLLAPLGLGVLGRHARENNLSAGGLTSFLSSQKSAVMSALPAGFSLGNLFDGDRERDRDRTTANVGRTENLRTEHVDHHTEKRGGNNWLWWLLLAAGIAALLWYFTSDGCNRDDVDDDTVATTTAPVTTDTTTTTTTTTTGTRESTRVRLANGEELNAYRGGVEDQLVACLNDAGCTAGNDRWFDFDNINFETGSARLTSESQQQVANIAAILKAYPNAKIKIGGYTDKTGNDADNKRLSQQRADAVMAAIKSAGATAGQLVGAEGYGSEFAKVDAAASDEERRSDRRIAVQLREK